MYICSDATPKYDDGRKTTPRYSDLDSRGSSRSNYPPLRSPRTPNYKGSPRLSGIHKVILTFIYNFNGVLYLKLCHIYI